MKLARDVVSSKGRNLLTAGTELEQRHMRVLNMWGISEIAIIEESEEETGETEMDEECLLAAAKRAQERFAVPGGKEPPYPELRRQYTQHTAARLAEGWTPAQPPQELTTSPPAPTDTLESFTATDKGLAALPDIYFRITEALDDPSCTAAKLSDIISKDTGLTARLLQLVNSPAMGQSRKVDTLSRGVVILGVREVSQLALGITVMSMFDKKEHNGFSVVEFWKHSLACGVLSRLLAARIGLRDIERFFVGGMLHDLGRMVLYRLAPEKCALSMRLAYTERIPLYEAESAIFGFDHCDVAASLFKRWFLPESLAEMIVGHHSGRELNKSRCDSCILNVADTLAVAFEFGCSGQFLCTGMSPGAWENLGLPDSAIAVTITQAERQLDDIYSVFLG